MQEKLIVRIADRPDLVPIVAGWLWHEWWHQDGHTLEQTHEAVAASVSPSGPPQSFVLLADGRPIGTASLVVHDLDERSDLTPWLVCSLSQRPVAEVRPPDPGGRSRLSVCRDPCGSLYTAGAERVYARAGWHSVETLQRLGRRPVTLMRRDLS